MTVHDHDQSTTAPWARALSFPAVLRDGRVHGDPLAGGRIRGFFGG